MGTSASSMVRSLVIHSFEYFSFSTPISAGLLLKWMFIGGGIADSIYLESIGRNFPQVCFVSSFIKKSEKNNQLSTFI